MAIMTDRQRFDFEFSEHAYTDSTAMAQYADINTANGFIREHTDFPNKRNLSHRFRRACFSALAFEFQDSETPAEDLRAAIERGQRDIYAAVLIQFLNLGFGDVLGLTDRDDFIAPDPWVEEIWKRCRKVVSSLIQREIYWMEMHPRHSRRFLRGAKKIRWGKGLLNWGPPRS